MRIAVVADIHLHDLHGGYGMVEEGSGEIALRTLEDTMASTRVFNESYPAFIAVLDDIVRRGIRDVVLLGDYSDDGQLAAVAAVKRILSSYEDQHGLRFFATLGNHDCFGPEPRHQSKRLTGGDGRDPLTVTSNGNETGPSVVCPGMRGMSTFEAMEAMAPYGIERPLDVLHWETPFGGAAELGDRRPAGTDLSHLDASYLIEPQDGLWLLILDANVFQREGEAWQVRANAAWDHVLAARPYLLPWIADVMRRGAQSGKTVLAFSHYPALPLAMAGEAGSVPLASMRKWAERMPSPDSGRRLAATGMRWHFSGHMHVSESAEQDGLRNIAVPSPVAFPGGYVTVDVECGRVGVEHIPAIDTADWRVALPAYRRQAGSGAPEHIGKALDAETYGLFLQAHGLQLTRSRPAG